MFIPDPGYTIIDADLAKADAQIVAWEAGDEKLKQIFREGEDIHTENAIDIFRCKRKDVNIGGQNSPRQKAKVGVHAVNYWVKVKTLAAELNITIKEADEFIKRWFAAHPEIKEWQERTWLQLLETRTTTNPFGFKRYWFEKLNKDTLLPDALAWTPQSTVALVINKGMINLYENCPEVQLLLQVHDSLVFQTLTELLPNLYSKIHKQMLITIPYEDPLTIQVGMKASTISWGDCKTVDEKLYNGSSK